MTVLDIFDTANQDTQRRKALSKMLGDFPTRI
jgi:hypothetical protein